MSAEHLLLEENPPAAIERAAQVLQAGGTIVFPTDTVYGLLAAADDAAAYRRIYALKQRPLNKPLALLAAAGHPLAELALALLAPFPAEQRQFAAGSSTLLIDPSLMPSTVLPADVREIQSGDIGVRRPDYQAVQALLNSLGGLVWATSANAAAEMPPASANQVLSWISRLASPPELVITSSATLAGHPSELMYLDGSGRLSHLTR